jgi:integrase/recombinase XerD
LARTLNQAERRGHASKTQSQTGLAAVIRETTRLWRRHDLGYDQTKYVVEHVRRELPWHHPQDAGAVWTVSIASKSSA